VGKPAREPRPAAGIITEKFISLIYIFLTWNNDCI
jgi:hypothetical protein